MTARLSKVLGTEEAFLLLSYNIKNGDCCLCYECDGCRVYYFNDDE